LRATAKQSTPKALTDNFGKADPIRSAIYRKGIYTAELLATNIGNIFQFSKSKIRRTLGFSCKLLKNKVKKNDRHRVPGKEKDKKKARY
jgi:hypothetical protein